MQPSLEERWYRERDRDRRETAYASAEGSNGDSEELITGLLAPSHAQGDQPQMLEWSEVVDVIAGMSHPDVVDIWVDFCLLIRL